MNNYVLTMNALDAKSLSTFCKSGQRLYASKAQLFLALAKSLSQDQCDALVNRQPLCLDNNEPNRDLVKHCLDFKWPEFKIDNAVANGKITIDGAYVGFIRFMILYHLNFLESILAAWNAGVASEPIIEEQFRSLTLSKADLQKFRNSIKIQRDGNDSYPSISNFMDKVSPQVRKPETRVA